VKSRLSLRKISAVLAVFVLTLCSAAQGPGSYPTITGTIVGREGAVIPDVKVTAKNIDQKHSFQARSNGAGTFRIAPLSVGHYVIYAGAPGWKLKEPVRVTVDISSEVKLTLKMEPTAKK
jgi:Carboxypeptidase regulatory-like domain